MVNKYYTYRVYLNPRFAERDNIFFIIRYDGEKKKIDSDSFQFATSEQLTKEEVKKLVGHTKGVDKIEGDFKPINPKYYTPTIEEFHIGFEYEEASTIPTYLHWDKATWGKDPNVEFEFLYSGIRDEHIRVKYLDKEDIESLGWVNRECANPDSIYQYFNIGEKSLVYTEGTHEVTIHLIEYDWDTCVFHGFIKNKSELSKVMQMLSIK